MPTRPSLPDALAAGPVVLDGGLSAELEARGCDVGSALWSARLLHDDPAAVVAAHAAFAAAGARVATTVSYQATVAGFAAAGVDAGTARRLTAGSVELARRGAPDGWVAGSVGPYGAFLADGSEYTGAYTDPAWTGAQRRRAHRGGAARVPPAAEEVFGLARGVAAVVAVGVNCTAPAAGGPAVRAAAGAGLPVVAHPNSGEAWDAAGRRWTGRPAITAPDVAGWVRDGARLVGGCCRVGPALVAGIATAVGELRPRTAARGRRRP